MVMLRARAFGAVLAAAILLAGCVGDRIVKSPPGMTTTLILLRHAERPLLGTELTAEGRARAAALPAALAGMEIDAIYSPNLSRNLDTAAPSAKQRGLVVKVIEATQVAARMIGENPGKTVLWVGNSSNLETIYQDIGGEGRAPILYGELFIIRVPDNSPARVTESRYGR